MASINYAARQISVKIVYYGPGLSGKTTNLQVIHKKTPQEHKSDMVSLATETDRTLFFDFLPLDLGKIKQFDTKFQLYTVPGQVYYNATRKLVLRGVDGVVFVADSGADKIQENLESFQNLEDNLAEYGYQRDSIPIILQYNKRDLPNALPIDELNRHINKYNLPYGEGIAYKGVGVFDTLKQIGKIVIDHLNRKYSRSGGARPAAAAPAAPAPAPAPAPAYQQYAPPPPAAAAYTAPAPSAYQPPPAAPQYAPPQPQYMPPPPPPAQAYAPQPSAWEQPQQMYQQQAQPYAAPNPFQAAAAPGFAPQPSAWEQPAMPSVPSFEMSAPAAPLPSAVTDDPFYVAPAQSVQTFEKPTVAQPAVEEPFFAQQAPPPQHQSMPSFEFGAPAPAPQPASIDYDDVFMVEPAAPQQAPNAYRSNQGGFEQSPFEFEMPSPPVSMGGTQQTIAPTGGGSEFKLESFSSPTAPPPPAAPAPDLSFDYSPFTSPAQPIAQSFGAVEQPSQGLGAAAKPVAQSFGAPADDGYAQFASPVSADPNSGKSELDIEIEKYQREIEEKQRSMRSGGMPLRPESQEVQPYPGPSNQANYQVQYQPPAAGTNALSDFEAELGGGRTDYGHVNNAAEEYPSDSAMFFTSVNKNAAINKRPGKPPVNPIKKMAQQQQTKGFMAKLLNKD